MTSDLVAWRPALDGLPDGWHVRRLDVEMDYCRVLGRVMLVHIPGGQEVELDLFEGMPNVREWLDPFLTAIGDLPVGRGVYTRFDLVSAYERLR